MTNRAGDIRNFANAPKNGFFQKHFVLQLIIPSKVARKEENQGESATSFGTAVPDCELTFCISETNNIQIYSTCCAEAKSKEFFSQQTHTAYYLASIIFFSQ